MEFNGTKHNKHPDRYKEVKEIPKTSSMEAHYELKGGNVAVGLMISVGAENKAMTLPSAMELSLQYYSEKDAKKKIMPCEKHSGGTAGGMKAKRTKNKGS